MPIVTRDSSIRSIFLDKFRRSFPLHNLPVQTREVHKDGIVNSLIFMGYKLSSEEKIDESLSKRIMIGPACEADASRIWNRSLEILYLKAISFIDNLHRKSTFLAKTAEDTLLREFQATRERCSANRMVCHQVERITVGLVNGEDVHNSRKELQKIIITGKQICNNGTTPSKQVILSTEANLPDNKPIKYQDAIECKKRINIKSSSFNNRDFSDELGEEKYLLDEGTSMKNTTHSKGKNVIAININMVNDGNSTPTYNTDINKFEDADKYELIDVICREKNKECVDYEKYKLMKNIPKGDYDAFGIKSFKGNMFSAIDDEIMKCDQTGNISEFCEVRQTNVDNLIPTINLNKIEGSSTSERNDYLNINRASIRNNGEAHSEATCLNNIEHIIEHNGFTIEESPINYIRSLQQIFLLNSAVVITKLCMFYNLMFPEYEISKLNDVFQCNAIFYSIRFSSGYEFTKEDAKNGSSKLILEYIEENWEDVLKKHRNLRTSLLVERTSGV